MGQVVKYTSDELKKKPSETDWDAVRNMSDAQIDEAVAGDPVWQEMDGDGWIDQV